MTPALPDFAPQRRVALALAGVAFGLVLSARPGALTSAFGTALGLAAALSLLTGVPRPRLSPRAGRGLDLLLLLALVALGRWLLHGLLDGRMPNGEDHQVHLHHAYVMREHLLPRGDLTGWSHLQFAGDPAFTLYAPLPSLLIAGSHWALGGSVSLEACYTGLVLATVVGLAVLVFVIARQLHVPRLGAWLGAVLVLLDRGIYNEGGWDQNLVGGVWPNSFALLWIGLAVSGALALLDRVTVPRLVGLALACGGSVLSHAVGFMYLGVTLLVLALTVALPALLEAPRRTWPRVGAVVAATAVGSLLGAFWLWPFLGLAGMNLPHGELWITREELAQRLLSLEVFGNTAAFRWPVFLGLVGLVAGFERPNPGHRVATFITLAFVGLATQSLWTDLGFDLQTGNFEQVNFVRLLAPARIALWAMGGAVLAAGLTRLPWRSLSARWGLLALGLLPVLYLTRPVLTAFKQQAIEPMRALQSQAVEPYEADVQRAFAWLRERHAEAAQAGRFERVLAVEPRGVKCAHRVPRETGFPVTHPGGEPTFHYFRRYHTTDEGELRALSVRWMLTCRSAPPNVGKTQVARFGDVTLYELPGASPVPFEVLGGAQVTMEHFDGELMRFHVSGASPDARLRLSVVGFPRWEAVWDGDPPTAQPIALEGLLGKPASTFMAVPLRDGRLEFRYGTDARQRLGIALSRVALSLLLLTVLVGSGRWIGAKRRRSAKPPKGTPA